jgi:hypothetical protein
MRNEPILSSDSDAVEQLQKKLAALEAQRDNMKAVNAAWRKYEKTKDFSALIQLGLTTADIDRMSERIAAAYSWEKQPYVGWQLTNLGATIRSVKERIIKVSGAQAQPERKIETPSGITYEDSPADNRVRLFFPGKPDEAVRSKLKSNGFRWTPSLGCWQAYRNYRAEMVAREMIAPTEILPTLGGEAVIEAEINGKRVTIDNEAATITQVTPDNVERVFPYHDDTNENAL